VTNPPGDAGAGHFVGPVFWWYNRPKVQWCSDSGGGFGNGADVL
jgi:hypothetical protein